MLPWRQNHQQCASCASQAGRRSLRVDDNERNLRNKVSRGKFTAGFLLQCLATMEVKDLRL
ncbi:DUF6471 domain-containing protein [Paracoccus benzoatiresistens]|uniref:DUF6471 domain-containing protein n=1 Tax=Paracoccus benzoatiresistens TaxID=2997341 RepID=UPI0035303712